MEFDLIVDFFLFLCFCVWFYRYCKVEKELKEAKREIERLKMKAIRKDSL